MVNHATNNRFPYKASLQYAIESAVDSQANRMRQKSIAIHLDFAADTMVSECNTTVREALGFVLGVVVDRSPFQGEVHVAGCRTCRGLEIEIADSGDESAFPRMRAFRRKDCRQLINFPSLGTGIELYGAVCPQGGMAWTIVATRTMAKARAA